MFNQVQPSLARTFDENAVKSKRGGRRGERSVGRAERILAPPLPLQHPRPAYSGAPTMPHGRRDGRRRGTQAEGPRGARAAARNRFGHSPRPDLAPLTNEATQAASTCHGDTAVVRDPPPSAIPSSADNPRAPR